MKISTTIIKLTLLLFVFSPAAAAKTLKIATLAPAGTSWMKQMKEGARIINERTEGRVKIKFYPGGVMGNDQSVHRKIKIGQLHGGAFTPGGLAQIDNSIQSLGIPLMFDTLAEVDYVRARMDSVLKKQMESSGFVILGISEGGFVRILSKQPMQDLESIRDSKVWIPEGDRISEIFFRQAGISPISLPIADVFTGLQTGLIETVAVNPTSAISFQWHTSTSYMTEIPLAYLVGILAVQKKAFSRLSAADQAIVKEEMARIFERMDERNREDNLAAEIALQNQGITFVRPNPGETERWKSITESSIDELVASGVVSRDIVGQVKSHLQSFRDSR